MSFPVPDLVSVDPATFTGGGRVARIAGSRDDTSLKLYWVEFDAGSRTNWHTHSGTQILLVHEGRCRYQRQGEPVSEIGAGETVTFESGELHWHGAAADAPMAHLAVNIRSDTTWHEPVTDAQYFGDEGDR
jgi:quercetin dioxygenase-like cupin family protein